MLLYEHDRTEDVVKRLIAIAKLLRWAIILASVLFFGILGIFVGSALTRDANMDSMAFSSFATFGFITGALAGILIGGAFAAFVSAVLEWMAQVLIAQGETVAALKRMSS